MRTLTLFIIALFTVSNIFAQGYKKPPQNVLDVLNAPAIPQTSLSPNRKQILLIEPLRYPPISEFAQPMLRLAGLRINPNTTGQYRPTYAVKLTLKSVKDGKEMSVQLPPNAQVVAPQWSADGERIAFGNVTPTGVELWIADTDSGKAKKLKNIQVNMTMGSGFQWMPDQKSLLVQTVSKNRGVAPQYTNLVPEGPSIQETAGRSGAVQTVQDLLKSPNDEKLFDYYATSQLAIVDKDGKAKDIGQPAIFDQASVSPDGQHILTSRIQRPYSYLFALNRFPKEVEVLGINGNVEYKVASLPLQDRLTVGGVPTGPRSIAWHPIEPATLLWAEALDEGNPRNKVPFRDKLMKISAPFSSPPNEFLKTEQRLAGRSFGEKDGMMLVADYNRDTEMIRTYIGNFNNPNEPLKLIQNLNTNDRYNDMGDPVVKLLPTGRSVIRQDGDNIFLDGAGASPEGDRPFLHKYNWKNGKKEELFRSNKDKFETFLAFGEGDKIITRRESTNEPPNLFMDGKAITTFADPTPQLRAIKKQLVKYKRADGVDLSFTLYLPPNYQEGTRLPTLVWAYPLEFTDASTAGQVSGSTNRFTSIGGMSHLFFLLQGYAVLDNTTMPIVGNPETVNETFIQQVVASAQAAIDKAVEMGVTDRDRVGVGGHSYGAFMTANLLAHSDIFRAGIARSGAYNRTLTPFGFQSERRSFWEAKDMYLKVSPFVYADKINEPILMTHGEADNNQGTFPIQSERLFAAIRGNGGTAKLVMLPYESHGYAARESIEHTLFEMISWFDKHVKNAKPRK
jgi:dipeptidyl aminopeptidase/acylaminoacyl peptidase